MAVSRTISIGVRPGRTRNLTQSQCMKAINIARQKLSSVCGMSLPGSYSPTLYIFFVSPVWAEGRFPSLKKHAWEAFAYGRGIYINNQAPAKTVARMATVVTHEILHTWGYANAPAMGHNQKQRWCMMYVSSSKTNFFCPAEVLFLQRKYGLPRKKFQILPLVKAKNKMAHYKAKHKKTKNANDLAQYNKWKKRTDALKWSWKKIPMAIT